MLTLVCRVDRKSRREGVGTRHILAPFAHQYASENGVVAPSLDLERTHITISDLEASHYALRAQDYDPAKLKENSGFDLIRGGTQVVLTEMGAMYLNVFLGSENQKEWLTDLDASLVNPALFVHLTLAGTCRFGESKQLTSWLDGGRFASQTCWDRVPDFSLARAHQ